MQSVCLADQTLQLWQTGRLPADELALTTQHLAECSLCQARAHELTRLDTWTAAVSTPPPTAIHVAPAESGVGPSSAVATRVATAVPAESANPLWNLLGTLLGPYRLQRCLGMGGMGCVYAAHDTQLERPVAVKVMKPIIAAEPLSRQRFFREAKAAAALRSPHIVVVYQVGEDHGQLYLAMEYLEGDSLESASARYEQYPLDETLRIGAETAEGLAVAHAKGLVHRDIKPANLWLEKPDGLVKILDFGLAVPAIRTEPHLTGTSEVVGTPAYMSPEQARNDQVTGASDIFSLGCVLYRLLSGRLPFSGETLMAQLTALALDAPEPLANLNRAVPPAVIAFIDRMLAKEPSLRPTAAEVARTLRALTCRPAAPVRSRFGWVRWAIGAGVAALGLLGVIIIIESKDGSKTKIEVPDGAKVTIVPAPTVPAAPPVPPRPPTPTITNLFAGPLYRVNKTDGMIALSRDGKWLAVPKDGRNGSPFAVWVFDTATRLVVKQLGGLTSRGFRVMFSADGEQLAAISINGGVRVWRTRDWQVLHTLQHPDLGLSVVFHPKGHQLATGGNGTVKLWNLDTGAEQHTLRSQGHIHALTYSATGERLVVVGQDGLLQEWNPANGQRIREKAWPGRITVAATFSPNGQWLAIGGTPGVWLLRADTWAENFTRVPLDGAGAVSFTPDSTSLWLAPWEANAGKNNQRLLRLDLNGNPLATFAYPELTGFASMLLSPDGKTIYLANQSNGVVAISASTGQPLQP
jgi:hypothetical protein